MVQFFGGFEGAAQTPRVRIARFGSGVYKIFEVKICLNMNSKTDKENRSYDDIAFLSEIIVNFRFWQVSEIFREQKFLDFHLLICILV